MDMEPGPRRRASTGLDPEEHQRFTDHRLQLTLHKLDAIVEGDLEELLTALRNHYQAALLEEQSDR